MSTIHKCDLCGTICSTTVTGIPEPSGVYSTPTVLSKAPSVRHFFISEWVRYSDKQEYLGEFCTDCTEKIRIYIRSLKVEGS